MFAAIVLERDPAQWSQLPSLFQSWLHSAGGVSALCLLVFTLAGLMRSHQSAEKRTDIGAGLLGLGFLVPPLALMLWLMLTTRNRWTRYEQALQLPFLYLGTSLTLFLYLIFGLFYLVWPEAAAIRQVLNLASICGLVMILSPVVVAMITRVRWGRIWALARLSLMESVRSRVVAVFALMTLIFLFADWFVPYKTEDQLRNYVRVVYWSMTPLFLMTVSMLGSFSLPADIKNQSIHTIVTKPVERIEIVLGRFLGFGILLTAGVTVVAVVSYLYIWRGITPEARDESFKARVPLYGNLYFFHEKKAAEKGELKSKEGESVGRVWGYRSYIAGPHITTPNAPKTYAVWEFDDLPTSLGEDDERVPFEFTFDIFRLNKGEENKGVFCTFVFSHGSRSVPDLKRLRPEIQRFRDEFTRKTKISDKAKVDEAVIQQFGIYEVQGFEVTDYHTQALRIPAAFFKMLRAVDEQSPRKGEPGQRPPAMIVAIDVDRTSHSQLVGVARRDMYILSAEQPFWQNFFKGIIGMWFSFLLVLGIGIACSTYLSGTISWLCTLFLYGAGVFKDYIMELATNTAVGGGPTEAVFRIAKNTPITVPLDPTPSSSIVTGIDEAYRMWLRLFLHIIPDVNRFDLHAYVANGFDIAWSQVILLDNFIYLAGYLLPWMVLAYYLMRFREIANPT